jgi:low affinity Fe/Cu permease
VSERRWGENHASSAVGLLVHAACEGNGAGDGAAAVVRDRVQRDRDLAHHGRCSASDTWQLVINTGTVVTF